MYSIRFFLLLTFIRHQKYLTFFNIYEQNVKIKQSLSLYFRLLLFSDILRNFNKKTIRKTPADKSYLQHSIFLDIFNFQKRKIGSQLTLKPSLLFSSYLSFTSNACQFSSVYQKNLQEVNKKRSP